MNMYPYFISIRKAGTASITIEVRGAEAAYDRYRMACLALAPDCTVDLCDYLTGEVLASSSEDWD